MYFQLKSKIQLHEILLSKSQISICTNLNHQWLLQAIVKVGGNVLNALTIEHFILRLPYHLKYVSSLLELHKWHVLEMEAIKFVAEIFVPLKKSKC